MLLPLTMMIKLVFLQAHADQSGMDSFISEGDDTAMQLFGVDDSPSNVRLRQTLGRNASFMAYSFSQNSPALPKLSSRATALLTAADKSTMARVAGTSLGSVPESPDSTARGMPMTAADLDISAASVGLLGISDSPAVPELSASLGASLRRGSMRTPGKNRNAAADKHGKSFLTTLSPILPQPSRTVGNAQTPDSHHQEATSVGAASDSETGDSPAMPTFKSATTRAVLGRSLSASTAVATGSGAGFAAAAPPTAAHDSDSEEEGGGQSDFDLSLFPVTFRSGTAAEQLIDVWSQFAMQDEGSFFDGGRSTASGSATSGALSELEVHQGVPDMTDKKLQLLLGMLESKALVRKFTWKGETMWRKR